MSQAITQATDYLHALTLRERILVLAVICAVVYLVTDALVLSSHQQHVKAISQQQTETQQLQQGLATEINKNIALLAKEKEKNLLIRQQIKQSEQELSMLSEQLATQLNKLVPPTKITELLRSLLSHTTNLKILSLNNESVKEITAVSAQNNTATSNSAKLYEHATIIELSGEYQQLYNYLQALENSHWQLLWDTLNYQVIDYPKARITLRVRTISTDEYWLGL